MYAAILLWAASITTMSHAATIVSTVGVPPSGCSTVDGCPTGASQPDLSGTLTGGFISSDFTWAHSFGVITDTILSATLTLDIIDADGGNLNVYVDNSSGAPVGMFDPAGNNSGGGPGPWRVPGDPLDPVMTVVLSSSIFSELADGMITFFGDNISLGIWGTNTATLTIETTGGTSTVPVPAALPLLATAFGGLGFLGWRRRRSASA